MDKPRARATNAEIENRLTEIQSWLLDGLTRSKIIKKAKGWGAGDRTIDEYIARAKEEILEINQADREENMSLITANLWDLYRFQRMNDPGEARKILMDIAKLRGLEETTVNHILKDRPLENMPDDELEGLLGSSTDGSH